MKPGFAVLVCAFVIGCGAPHGNNDAMSRRDSGGANDSNSSDGSSDAGGNCGSGGGSGSDPCYCTTVRIEHVHYASTFYSGDSSFDLPASSDPSVNLLIAILALGHDGITNPSVTPPPGWNLLARVDHPGQISMFVLTYRVPPQPPHHMFSFTHLNGWGWLVEISGASPLSPTAVTRDDPTTATTYTAGSLTPSGDVIMLGAFASEDNDYGIWSPPMNALGYGIDTDGGTRSGVMFRDQGSCPTSAVSYTATDDKPQDFALSALIAIHSI
jgi:hypothetical protein